MPLGLRAINPRRVKLINPELTDKEMRAGLRKYLQAVRREMRKYPPDRPESTYVRTYVLKDSWEIRTPSRYYAELVNTTAYAGFVQGPRAGQSAASVSQRAQFRRWGWRSITDVSRELQPLFGDIANRAIRASIN